MTPPVYVTGASGFLGRAVVRGLRHRGVAVVPVGRAPWGEPDALIVANYDELAPPKGACLVHLAEPNDVAAAEAAGRKHLERVFGTCRALLAKPWGRVFYASSAIVYGDREAAPRKVSDAPVAAPGWYQQGKLACEREVVARGGVAGRFANLIGPGMSPNTVLSDILAQLGRPQPLTVRDGGPVRDFLWIDDAAAAVGAAVAAPLQVVAGRIFNIGSGRGVGVRALAEMVLAHTGETSREVVSQRPDTTASRLVLDIAETTEYLGWAPRVGLGSALDILTTGTES